ncbi:hypothetical protein TNCV_4739611 [Trichonephila clavipes]|nr:hypothetical protein TNCV_4739611 [Trichonephila clavipes]
MDVCKCIVPLLQGGTLNSRRAASPLVRLVAEDERWEAPHPCPGWNRAKSYCTLYGGQDYGQRQACIWPSGTQPDPAMALCSEKFTSLRKLY